MTKQELRKLWDAKEAAAVRYQHIMMTDTGAKTADERFELDIEAQRACRLVVDTSDAFNNAAREFNAR